MKIKHLFVSLCVLPLSVLANTLNVPVYHVAEKGFGVQMGSISFEDTEAGLLITPDLSGFTTGIHGFHLHANPSCDDNGTAAGGHFDPDNTGQHLGPYDTAGHLGDMPALYANADGDIILPVLAPRLTTEVLMDHAIIVHAGGDNYSDEPAALGGGGARVACALPSMNDVVQPEQDEPAPTEGDDAED